MPDVGLSVHILIRFWGITVMVYILYSVKSVTFNLNHEIDFFHFISNEISNSTKIMEQSF